MRPGVRKLRARIASSTRPAAERRALPAPPAPVPAPAATDAEPVPVPPPSQESSAWVSAEAAEREPRPEPEPRRDGSAWLVDPAAAPTARAVVPGVPASRRRRVPWGWIAAVVGTLALAGGTVAVILALWDEKEGGATSAASETRTGALDERRARTAIGQLDGLPQIGGLLGEDREAPTLHVYAEITTPAFARFDAQVLGALLSRYVRPGRLNVQLRTLPGDTDVAEEAARWAQAAGLQTRLWQYVRALAAFDGRIREPADLEAAGRVVAGLDVEEMDAEARTARIARALGRGSRLAREADVSSTPGFVVSDGPRSVRVAVPRVSDRFMAALRAALRRLEAAGGGKGG